MMGRFCVVVALTVLFVGGCSKQDDTLEENQRTAFTNYLTNNQYVYTEQSGVYRCILNTDRDGYSTATVLDDESSAIINFAVYAFSSSNGKGELYYTNRKDLVDEESLTDLEHYWSFDPQEISLGDSRLVKGVRLGLDGCREGDSVLLFVVSKLGYGSKQCGLVPPDTPLVWDIVVSQVIK